MDWDCLSTDELEGELVRLERLRRQVTAGMVALVGEADRRQAPLGDGCRSTAEWVAARLDVSADEARVLSDLAVRLGGLPETASRLAEGVIGATRAHAVSRVADSKTEREWLSRLECFDLAGVERLVGRLGRVSRGREREMHARSFVSVQPSLDESWWRIRGGVSGVAGRVISKALAERADELPKGAGSREHRQALALEQLCLGEGSGSEVAVTAFVDLGLAGATDGEAGVELAAGSRLGPDGLEELLCQARTGLVGLRDGRPVVTTARTRRIPPAVRDFVLWRDGACRASGCRSTYRLQPHHVVPHSHGGNHHPDNLVTLCWFHHHVVVHRRGYRIEPDTDGRIRFVPPADSRDPPP